MSRSHKPKALGQVIDSIVDRLGIRKELDAAVVIEAWAALVGDKINGVTDSAWLKGDTLYVKVTSAAWRQQLHMNRSTWRDRLNEELGRPLVREIVFR